jgi:tetratricopeptide (TPR) repeat protein
MPGSSTLRTILFTVVTLLLLFVGLELVLRLAVTASSGYLERREELTYEFKLWQMQLFDSFMGMHESDLDLFWRLKPDYSSALVAVNSKGFSGPELGPKQPGELRVLFLGDSTPLGIGLADWRQSFVFQLEELLRDSLPDVHVRIINAATAGYSSWQCRRLLELRGDELQPDIVVCYFGNNDPSINGVLSDHQLAELTSEFAGLKRWLGYSYIYQMLRNLWFGLQRSETDQQLVPRVSPEEFTVNLAAISTWCESRGIKPAFCTIPTPLLWPPGIQFKPFAGGQDSQGRLVMAENLRDQIGAAWSLVLDTMLLPGRDDLWTSRVYAQAYTERGDFHQNERFYLHGLESDPNNTQYLNNLAVLRWHEDIDAVELLEQALAVDSLNPIVSYNLGALLYDREPKRARHLLRLARERDQFSLRIKSSYNARLRQVGSKHAALIIDLEQLLAELPEAQAYVDHCHPTLIGHKLISRKLFREIAPFIAQAR